VPSRRCGAPSYDPNLVASHDFSAAKAAKTFYDAFPGKPLLANSYQERYLPGSTFKVITATAALESGKYTLDSYFPPVDSYLPPQTTKPIHNYGGSTCGGTFVEVFRRSCNTAFAEMAVNVGAPDMVATAEPLRLQLRAALRPAPASEVGSDRPDFVNNIPLLAIAGFGQGNTQATC
jgi:peptidoglycan glycosyltransferase